MRLPAGGEKAVAKDKDDKKKSKSKKKKADGKAKVAKVLKGAKKIAQNPMAAEIVAATLVAAAAALRNPKRAQALAVEAADDLKKAAKTGVDGGALWQLALDVARRSIDAIGAEGDEPKKGGSKKGKK